MYAYANTISEANSTTTPLNAAAVFTGTAEDVTRFDSVVLAVKTDQDGTYSIQFSNDGTNWDSVLTRYYRTNQTEAPHRFTITRRYCRVVFTNTSASNQTYLRLQTVFGKKADLNSPLDSTVSQDFDALMTRPTDYNYEVALGRRQGATTWNKFGYNLDIDVGTEIIAAFGGTFTILSAASTLTIVSSSTDDDGSPAGTGARTITITGVDADYIAQVETVTMNGTTSVVTTSTWRGINRAAVSLSGSNQTNVGTITITATTGGSTQASIPAGVGTSQQAIFFTQANRQGLADFLLLNAEKTGAGTSPKVTFDGWVFNSVTNTRQLVFKKLLDTSADNTLTVRPSQPFVLPEKSCLYFTATTDINDTIASLRFSLIEVNDIDA